MTTSVKRQPEAGSELERSFACDAGTFRRAPFVAGALLEFGRELRELGESRLAPAGEADLLVRSNPFAFLVAVILDQGVPAERAFTAPLVLEQRLGPLRPGWVLRHSAQLRRAMKRPPMPHRYPDRSATWILAAARKVVEELGGETDRLWADAPTARALRQRLEEFDGIGQKKSAMAVEILAQELGTPVADLDGSDVAVDVHVRRVFTRTGLASSDAVQEIVEAARDAYPERPGELDAPTWVIGRTWCRPRIPSCGDCPIAWACPSASSLASKAPSLALPIPPMPI